MNRGTAAAVMLLLPLIGCSSSSDPSSSRDTAATAPSPKTTSTPGLLREAEQWNSDITKAIRYVVLANEPDHSVEQSRQKLDVLQAKALESFADAERTDPQNPAVFKARAHMRWNWLGASMDMPGGPDVRRERTEDVNKTLEDLDRAITLDPTDSESLILRGRVVLLEWVELELLHSIKMNSRLGGLSERMKEFGVEPLKSYDLGTVGGMGYLDQTVLPPACDRAIADFSLAIQTRTNEAQAYYWRSLAFWYKVLALAEMAPTWERTAIEAAVKDDLEQATKNVEQARFLLPQNAQFKKHSEEVSGFLSGIPPAMVAAPVVYPVKSAQEVFAEAAPAVVLIKAQTADGTRQGSGSIVSRTGLVITNKHVVAGATNLSVTLKNGRTHSAALVANHEVYDLALIRLSGDVSSLPVLLFAGVLTAGPGIGDDVVMIGHPVGMQWTLTAGKVSQIRGSTGTPGAKIYLQTDAAANPGNSGGPLLSMQGFMVGVVTFDLKDSQGMTFSIYADVAKAFVSRYK